MNQPDEPLPVTAPLPLTVTGSVGLAGTPAVAVANTPTVSVGNSQSSPLFVTQAAAGKEPFQLQGTPVFGNGDSTVSSELFTVPDQKLLVIQYVSAESEFRGDDRIVAAHITTTVGGVRAGHNIEIDSALRNSRGTGFTVSTLTQEMTVYADSGTTVRITVERSPAGEGSNIFVTVSGYLLDRSA